MMLSITVAILLATVACAYAFVVPYPHDDVMRTEWELTSDSVAPETMHGIVLALKNDEKAVAELDDLVMSVSDPNSPKYENVSRRDLWGADISHTQPFAHLAAGKYWTLDEVTKRFAPPGDAVKAVQQWARAIGAVSVEITRSRDFVSIVAPVGALEKALSVRFGVFRHKRKVSHERVRLASRDGQVKLPMAISKHVELVIGLTDMLSPPKPQRVGARVDGVPMVTPRDVRSAYNVASYGDKRSTVAVSAFEDQYISMSDLAAFQKQHGLLAQRPTVIGQNDESSPGGESTLDIQCISGVCPGCHHVFFSLSKNGTAGSGGPAKPPGDGAYILAWAMAVANMQQAPLVTSHSYGDTEQGYFKKFGNYDYITRTETELGKQALRGLSVLGGSGDAGWTNVGEAGNDISQTDPDCSVARPFYPSNSKYVTSVGGTFFSKKATPYCSQSDACDFAAEVPAQYELNGYTTGGGYSGIRPVQPWQKAVVDRYNSEYLPNSAIAPSKAQFNITGRGYPDTCAQGVNYVCILNGAVSPIGGTSMAGPLVAGLFGIINAERLAAGKKPIGFANPVLYQSYAKDPSMFNDVVFGSNKDGVGQSFGSSFPSTCPKGFEAAPGWDPVSGLGSLNVGLLARNWP